MPASAQSLYDRGLTAIGSGRPREGARLLRAGLRAVGPPVDDERRVLTTRLLTSLAAAEVQLGDATTGFGLLDRAEALASSNELGLVLNQRGLLLTLVGRFDEAQRFLDESIPLLAGDPVRLARGLLNRSMLHDLAGRIRAAIADLDACEQVAKQADLPRIVAKVQLNRGHCQTVLGDIPAAVSSYNAASLGFAEHAPALRPVIGVDKARALLVAGLATEAAAEVDHALGLLARGTPTHERAEAELVRAQVALAQGEPRTARVWARRAERNFRRRGNYAWGSELAVLTRLRAEFLAGLSSARLLAEATALADRLTRLSLHTDAEHAELLAAGICVALRRYDDAARHLVSRRVSRPTTETKLARRLVTARLQAARGQVTQVYAQIRAGLTVLNRHREQFGSIDIQTGTAALGVRLADLGLATALRHSAPPVVFAWLERSRAQAFRLRPVIPPSDDETTDAVAELRKCAQEARKAELSGRRDVALQRQCVELERGIRARGWAARGNGVHTPTASFGEVTDELRRAGAALLSFVADAGRLRVLVVVNRTARLVEAGDLAAVTESVARLRGDLDALCGRRLRPTLEQVVRASARHQLALLSDELIRPLLPLVGDRELVIVPTRSLSAVPWGLLPALRGRPVTVTPSATHWLTGHRDRRPPPRRPLLVAGPDLLHAIAEVTAIARILPDSTVLSGRDASVSATLAAVDGQGLVHFTAHGHHEQDNVLFSRLDLADGPLMAYDVHQLQAAPHHVVLSSCDVGRAVVRSGDELVGFTAALLYGGTRTVIAGVARLPDDAATADVMAGYHRLVAQGTAPASALAEAVTTEPFMPLVCFGSG